MRIVVIASLDASLLSFRGHLLSAMDKLGHQVFSCAPENKPATVTALKHLGVEYRQIRLQRSGLNILADAGSLWRLTSALKHLAPDLVFCYTIKPVIYGSLAASRAGVKNICSMITGLGVAFVGEGWRARLLNRLAKSLYRAALRKNRVVFFQNTDDQRLFQELRLLHQPEQAVTVNGSGVDLDYYYACPPVVAGPVFLLVARLLKEKGIREFVAAAARLKKKHAAARFVIVGGVESSLSAIAPEQIRFWSEKGLIEYHDWTVDVRPLFAACSVYVLPSYREGTPRTVLEAMAMSRPIVTTNTPGCRETICFTENGAAGAARLTSEGVLRGLNGFLVPVKNVELLETAMEQFILEPELITRMGQNSRRLAERRFDVKAVNAVMLKSMGLWKPNGDPRLG